MNCVGKKSSEIKDDLVLITMFAGTQANAYNQTHFTRWLHGHFASIPVIDLQEGIRYLSMIHVYRHPSQCIQPN